MSRGIFSLKQVYGEQLSNDWSEYSNVKLTESPFYGQYDNGWFVGGMGSTIPSTSGSKNHRQRIDYSNDTTIVQTLLPVTTSVMNGMGAAGFGSPSHHYSVGGTNYYMGGEESSFKFSYANSSFIYLGGNNSSPGAWCTGTVSNDNYGYTAGGANGATNNRSIISRMDFSNDFVNMDDRAELTLARRGLSGVGNQSYAWFGGGNGTSPGTPGSSRYSSDTSFSTVDRLDYSSDTTNASPKGPLSGSRGYVSATGNANYGYFGGGCAPNVDNSLSSIDRVDYSNDTVTASPKGPLTASIWGTAATGNQVFGYWSGGVGNQPVPFGFVPGGNYNVWRLPAKTTVQRLDFSSDTATTLDRANLSTAVLLHGSSSAKDNAKVGTVLLSASTPKPIGHDTGYFAGGYPSYLSSVERIDYSNDTATASQKGPLVNAVADNAAGLSSKDYGYFAGGRPSPSVAEISSIQRIDYLNDTATALVRGNMTDESKEFSGTNTADFGYLFKGSLPTVERLDYSNDTATTLAKAPLPNNAAYNQTAGNQSFGYGLGHKPGAGSKVSRIDYSNDTATALERGLLATEMGEATASGNAEFGYVFGGIYAGSRLSTTQRVEYANDTATAVTKGPLTVARQSLASTGNTSFGYVSGGTPGPVTTIDRIDYANDTATASSKGPLSAARYLHARTSSRSDALPTTRLRSLFSIGDKSYAESGIVTNPFGYFVGGSPGSPRSTAERLDYTNDNVTTSTRATLNNPVRYSASVASATHLYITGGGTPGGISSVQRIHFAHDTNQASLKGPLNAVLQGHSATGNKDYAWIGAGTSYTTVNRIDYSNDSATASPKGPLSVGRSYYAGTGNQSYGYFGGGDGPKSSVDRVDYSNDTDTASPKGPLTQARSRLAATGNADYGWFGGGGGIPIGFTTVDRIDFSNDTATASPRGNFSVGRSYLNGATGSSDYGYWAGGYYPAVSSISRVDYANDTNLAFLRGNLPAAYMGNSAGSARANGMPQIKAVLRTINTTATTPAVGYMYVFNQPSVFRYEYANDDIRTMNSYPGPGNMTSSFSSETHGYSGGHKYGGIAIQRIDYSNDTAALTHVASYSLPVQQAGSAGNRYYGYSAGGMHYPGPTGFNAVTTVFRVDYSSDTDTPTPKGNLSTARNEGCGVGNQDFGYFAGTAATTTDRIDYSNDTVTSTLKGGVNSSMGNRQATGNANYGYFGTSSNVTRLDYSNDTVDGVTKGNLIYNVGYASASGNKNFGYWMGGFSRGSHGNAVKFNFNNDTADGLFKAEVSTHRPSGFYQKSATSAAENGLPQP